MCYLALTTDVVFVVAFLSNSEYDTCQYILYKNGYFSGNKNMEKRGRKKTHLWLVNQPSKTRSFVIITDASRKTGVGSSGLGNLKTTYVRTYVYVHT